MAKLIPEFEVDILRYLTTRHDIVNSIDSKIFILWEHDSLLRILAGYAKKYKCNPTKIALLQYSTDILIDNDFKENDIAKINEIISNHLFTPFSEEESVMVKDRTIEFAKQREMELVFKQYAHRIDEGQSIMNVILDKVSRIVLLGEENIALTSEKGNLIIKEGRTKKSIPTLKMNYEKGDKKVISTFLEGLNNTMAAHGIYTPMLCLLLGGSKAYKTGFVIALAAGFIRNGFKVFYADGENGLFSIENRIDMCLSGCTLQQLIKDKIVEYDSEGNLISTEIPSLHLKQSKYWINLFGGEIVVHSYPSSTASTKDIDKDLFELKSKKGFIPDVIIYDDLDHFIPQKRQATDILESQATLKDVINLNKKWNTIAISPAQVNRTAIGEDIYTIKDIGRDYGKIKYAHSIWAINRSPSEIEEGIGIIHTVVQREGQSNKLASVVKINEEIQSIEELTYKQSIKYLQPKSNKKVKKTENLNYPKNVNLDKLTDE